MDNYNIFKEDTVKMPDYLRVLGEAIGDKKLPFKVYEDVESIYEKAFKENISLKNTDNNEFLAASALYSCQINKIPKDIRDIAKSFNINKKDLSNEYTNLLKKLELPIPDELTRFDFLESICSDLHVRDKVLKKAWDILDSYESLGKSQKTEAGAAVYLANLSYLENCIRITYEDIARVTNRSPITIRNYINDIINLGNVDEKAVNFLNEYRYFENASELAETNVSKLCSRLRLSKDAKNWALKKIKKEKITKGAGIYQAGALVYVASKIFDESKCLKDFSDFIPFESNIVNISRGIIKNEKLGDKLFRKELKREVTKICSTLNLSDDMREEAYNFFDKVSVNPDKINFEINSNQPMSIGYDTLSSKQIASYKISKIIKKRESKIKTLEKKLNKLESQENKSKNSIINKKPENSKYFYKLQKIFSKFN